MGHHHKFIPTPEDYMIAVSVQSSAGQPISQLQNFKTRNCSAIQYSLEVHLPSHSFGNRDLASTMFQ